MRPVSLENPKTQVLLIPEDAFQKMCSEENGFLYLGIFRATDTFLWNGNLAEGGQTQLAQGT